jgi:hypothetical protein
MLIEAHATSVRPMVKPPESDYRLGLISTLRTRLLLTPIVTLDAVLSSALLMSWTGDARRTTRALAISMYLAVSKIIAC